MRRIATQTLIVTIHTYFIQAPVYLYTEKKVSEQKTITICKNVSANNKKVIAKYTFFSINIYRYIKNTCTACYLRSGAQTSQRLVICST